MPQDAFMLKYIASELNEKLSGGKINKIVQPNNDSVIFTIYTGKVFRLEISADPSMPRINFLSKEEDLPINAPNFCMLLRKHLTSATITNISLVDFDRIVKIDLDCSQEFFDVKKKTLYVELMGRYSNIILTEEGKVLGANRGVNFLDNGVRPLIVNKPYVLPPITNKKSPFDQNLVADFNAFNGEKNSLGEYVFTVVSGLSIVTANEISARFYNEKWTEKNENFGRKLFDFLVEFIGNTKPQPCVIKDGNLITDVLCFNYQTVEGERVFFDSVLQADNVYFENKISQKIFRQKKERVVSIISTQIKKIKKRLSFILSRKKDAESAEENKIKGELILANIYAIKTGDKIFSAFNYYNNTTLEITLNPDLSPSQNSNAYYKKYTKQKRALTALLEQEEIATTELNYLTAILDEISLAESIGELDFVYEEIKNYGLIKDTAKKRKVKDEQIERRVYLIDGFIVSVGRNNIENDNITFTAKPHDLWLHAKLFHSSHVVIKTENRPVSDNVIKICAEICAYYSKARESGNTEIVFTQKRFVKKPPKSKPGSCIYTDFSSITVKPNKHGEYIKN